MKAEFSIKENLPDGKQVLTMGTVYCDKNARTIVYKLTFPKQGLYVLTDSASYEIENDKIVKQSKAYNLYNFSIYNLALSSGLYNYGLTTGEIFKLTNVVREDSLVVSTYSPAMKELKKYTGDVKLSTRNKQLYGLAFFDNAQKLLSKQFFTKYTNYKGFSFPGEILQINYINGKEYYKVTTYKNVVVNAANENELYNYAVPVR
jgi:hypothetical protein